MAGKEVRSDDDDAGDGDGKELPKRVRCLYCGKLMAPGRGRRKKFCTEAHKQASYRERKKREREAVG